MSDESSSKKKIEYETENNQNKLKRSHFFIIFSSIMIFGLLLRVYYLPVNVPITLDGLLFFWYANDISLSGSFPLDYTPANNGWPIFLSFFFHIFDSNNFMDYMILQRLVTSVLSILTIIPIYFLCRKFFSEKLALMGSLIFAFEPRIIQNSVLGVTEPLFILLISTSIVCFLNKQKFWISLSFPLIALASIVRSEGIILIIPYSILYIIKFRGSKKTIIEIPILILIFILVILPISVYKIDVTGEDAIFSRSLDIFESNVITNNESSEYAITNTQTLEEIRNIFLMIGWTSIPIFIILTPYGFFKIFKERRMDNFTIITILCFLSIPAIYAVSFLPDTKYLYVLFPILCLISVFSIKKFVNLFSNKNLGFMILVSLILIASISFLEIKKIDTFHEDEALKVAEIVSKQTKKINQYTMESGYLPIIGMNELEKFPVMRNEFIGEEENMKHCYNIHSCKYIIPVKNDNIIEFLKNANKQGISHLVIDDKEERRKPFVKEVFQNENKFPYLIKIYDSKNDGFNYNVKIFEINFEKFNELYS